VHEGHRVQRLYTPRLEPAFIVPAILFGAGGKGCDVYSAVHCLLE
jgi:hypothetical protein